MRHLERKLDGGHVLAVRACLLDPALRELARVLDRLLSPGAVVAPAADAVTVRLAGVVALGVAAALIATGGLIGDQGCHPAPPSRPGSPPVRTRTMRYCRPP